MMTAHPPAMCPPERYYHHMYELAMSGDPWAQREYATMLRSYDKVKDTFKESYQEADMDQLVDYGFQVRHYLWN